MNRLRTLCCLGGLLLASCGGHHGPSAGNVNLLWSFGDGATCSSLGGAVSHMQVTIPGEALQNGGSFPCQVAGTQGIQLQNFAPGTYDAQVDAIDPGGFAIYSGSVRFTVNGNVTAAATLSPVASPGNVDILWQFSDGNTCASLAGLISSIQITIPGEALQNGGAFPCQTAGTQGIELQNFAPGTYSYTVQAVDNSGREAYHAQGSFTVNGSVQVQTLLTPG